MNEKSLSASTIGAKLNRITRDYCLSQEDTKLRKIDLWNLWETINNRRSAQGSEVNINFFPQARD